MAMSHQGAYGGGIKSDGNGYLHEPQQSSYTMLSWRLALPDDPLDRRNQDAVFGEGVYACELGPETSREEVCASNHFDLLKEAGVEPTLLQKAVNTIGTRDVLDNEEKNNGQDQIRLYAGGLWDKTAQAISIWCEVAYKAVLLDSLGGRHRSVLVLHQRAPNMIISEPRSRR